MLAAAVTTVMADVTDVAVVRRSSRNCCGKLKNESYMCPEMKNEIRLLEDHITRCWPPSFYSFSFDKLELKVEHEERRTRGRGREDEEGDRRK